MSRGFGSRLGLPGEQSRWLPVSAGVAAGPLHRRLAIGMGYRNVALIGSLRPSSGSESHVLRRPMIRRS